MHLQDLFQDIVLCWLATANKQGQPNVSPKEMFLIKPNNELHIPNIASSKSLMNIVENPKVCVSGINIWKQKGIQCKGEATIVNPQQTNFKDLESDFKSLNKGRFRIQHFFQIKITSIKEITAPSYFFYPNTEEEDQIKASQKRYLKSDSKFLITQTDGF